MHSFVDRWPNVYIAKTAAQATKEETSDPIDPTKEPPKNVSGKEVGGGEGEVRRCGGQDDEEV